MEIDPAQLGTQMGGGAVIGFAAKKILKLAVDLVGIQMAALAYLEQKEVIAVDWDALQGMAAIDSTSGAAPSFFTQLFSAAPVGGGFTAGALIGFRRG